MLTLTPATNDVKLEDLTQAAVNGTGVFDTVMRALRAHLEQEYTNNRIRGPEYATVYLGALESALQTAVAFLLAQKKAGLEADLLALQKTRLNQEITNLVAQHDLLVQQKLNLEDELLTAARQRDKLDAEIDLLAQKKVTELAQTDGSSVTANSVIGKQVSLYEAQTNGFIRDAEQKAASILVDSWKVRRTTDEATVADGTNKLADTYIGSAVQKLLTGVGA